MIFHQFVNEDSGCLSYLLGCGRAGEALVVDPGRDRLDEYVRVARRRGLAITRILETHTHADHISGNQELAELTGAIVLLHRAAGAVFPHLPVEDGTELEIGQVRLRVFHTPGHTPDSICVLVTDLSRGPEPWFLLTGDTLFVGDVGRPDLGGADAATDLYESLHAVLLPLPDSVEVYPAHGAGSLCGRTMSAKTTSTLGFERRFNPAFRARTREEFVAWLLGGLPPKPPSVEVIVARNRGLLPRTTPAPRPYTARETWAALAAGACVLDLREPATFGEGHVPGAVNVWIESPQFGDRVSWFVPAAAPLILVAQGPSDLDRALAALGRVGIDHVLGYQARGMLEWRSEGLPVETVPQITVYDLAAWLDEGRDLVVIDVREPFEWREGHVGGALHLPMFEIPRRVAEVPRERPKAVLCAGGVRSSTAISVLKRHGISGCYNVTGGMGAWVRAGHAVVR